MTHMQKICCKYQGTLHPFYLYTRKIQWKHMWCCSGHCITKLYRIGAITTFMRIVVAFNTLSVILAYMTSNIINSCHVHRDLMVIRKQISNTLHVLHYLHMPIKLRDSPSWISYIVFLHNFIIFCQLMSSDVGIYGNFKHFHSVSFAVWFWIDAFQHSRLFMDRFIWSRQSLQ